MSNYKEAVKDMTIEKAKDIMVNSDLDTSTMLWIYSQLDQLATVTAEREAMREALETLATLGTTISESEYATGYNHAITIIKSHAAAALKGGKG